MPLIAAVNAAFDHHLLYHPIITTFEWTPGTTPFSTLLSLSLTVAGYLLLTLLLLRLRLTLSPAVLRPISTIHNLAILILSITMAVGTSISMMRDYPIEYAFCFPKDVMRRSGGRVFFWGYVFYLSKILEFVDTVLIILSGSLRRLTFLHVYHHATVVVMCYIWLETRQSLFPIALVTNATVHTVMYLYYLLAGLGMRPRWKRAVTDCQIGQFVFSFLVSGVMLWLHFGSDEGCAGIWGWCFNAVFNGSLLWLFLDFHKRNYKAKKEQQLKPGKED